MDNRERKRQKEREKYLKLTDIYDQIQFQSSQPINQKHQKHNSLKQSSNKSNITIKNHNSMLQLTNLNLINGTSSPFFINQLQQFYDQSHKNQSNQIDEISIASQRNKQYFTQSHEFFQSHQHDKKGLYLTKKNCKSEKKRRIFQDFDGVDESQPIAEENIARKVRHIWD